MSSVRFFNPALAYEKIKPEIDAEMQRVLASGDLILRADLEKFERSFAEYVGTKYAVGVASGTDALILSLRAAGIEQGDRVLAPSYTFRATIEAIVHAGGEPVLYDLEDQVHFDGIDYWIPAHIAGEVSPTLEADVKRAEAAGVIVIEDAAQAVGAAPVRGLTACYSFYPAKILGCYGDGGAVATNDKDIYDELMAMRNHYKGDWSPVGYNSRLDNLQAAVLNVKIKYLPDAIKRRKEIATLYDAGLFHVGKPPVREVYQDYIITCEDIEGLSTYLTEQGIETMRNGYPFPEAFSKGPKTNEYEAISLRLPCYPELTDKEVVHVINAINAYTM